MAATNLMKDFITWMKRTSKTAGENATVRDIAATNDARTVLLVRAGLPRTALSSTAASLGMSERELARILGLRRPISTKDKSKLTAFASDRLVCFARMVAFARRVFEDEDGTVAWLKSPSISLLGHTPLSLVDTATGILVVENVLYRIEYHLGV